MNTQPLVLPDWVKDTVVGDILSFQLNDEPAFPLVDPGDKIKPSEKIIGEMTHFEKAVYAVHEKITEDLKQTIENDPNPEKEKLDFSQEYDRKWRALEKKERLLKAILWQTIESRFPGKKSLGLREQFQIVEITDDEDCSICPVRNMCPNAH